MENIRKFYLPIVHFVSLGLLVSVLGTDLYVKRPYGGLRFPDDTQTISSLSYRVFSSSGGDFPSDSSRYSMENRALIVYTLLAIYLGSGYLLFKKN